MGKEWRPKRDEMVSDAKTDRLYDVLDRGRHGVGAVYREYPDQNADDFVFAFTWV